MAPPNLWKLTLRLAEIWRSSPEIREFTSHLPANRDSDDDDISEALLTVDGTSGFVSGLPLYPASWRQIATNHPLVTANAELAGYFDKCDVVQRAFLYTLQWVRSRFPGNPRMYAPHLARNGPRLSLEICHRISWDLACMAILEKQSTPYQIGPLLKLRSNAGIDRATRKVAEELQRTSEWQRLADAFGNLTTADLAKLLRVRENTTRSLSSAAVGAHEPDRAHRREVFREETFTGVVSELAGRAREYIDAFDKLDKLADLVFVDILGQLVAYGAPIVVFDPVDLEITTHQGSSIVSFRSNSFTPRVRQLIWVNDPLVADVLQVNSVQVASTELDVVTEIEATGIPGTRAAWMPPR